MQVTYSRDNRHEIRTYALQTIYAFCEKYANAFKKCNLKEGFAKQKYLKKQAKILFLSLFSKKRKRINVDIL